MIKAQSIYGNIIKIPKEQFQIRVSAYGIIRNKENILLVNTRSSGKWFFPGGQVEIGETLKNALKREVMEETGIKIKIEKFLTFKELYFYYDPLNKAWQNYAFFYICKPETLKLTEKNQIEFDESEKPAWINLSKLNKNNLQDPVNEILSLI